MAMKFYICRHCGNIITKLTSSKVPLHCCGQPMELLEAGVTDAATEKHVPVVTVEGNLVKVAVGAVPHPMVEEHFIQWVAVETERDALVHWFHPGEAPEAVFALAEGQQVKAVYEYCNLHGLWKKDL
ncbi:desulfoferrodoxin family protein [Dysosmobacter sp.]|uniref:desulfoferrodoxin family protein n=1 Tax=Dysosmobacter sp. TaxID=2591382 RepID=UPI003A8FE67D